MRIVLDLQGAQNDSRFRGIGRYSLSLAREMVLAGSERHEFHLLLNRNLPEGLAHVVRAFDGLLPRSRFHLLELPHPSHEVDPTNLWRNRAAALIREAALHDLRPDLVHVSSLFEGFSDHSVTSIGALGETVPTAITLYDLIPLLRPDTYLGDALTRRWYYRKAHFARRADLLLAISTATAAEAETALHLPPGRVVTIGAGVDDKFRPVLVDATEATALRHGYRLQRSFVMYVGAADPRKNLSGLMRGFALLPAETRGRHCLAIVGRLKSLDLERLADEAKAAGLAENEVVFLGFVPDKDLIRLYALCAVLVFPSFHEGFGLPAAEAMACGAAVIGSDRTSIPEVIGRADALFDPADPASIAACLARVLTDPGFRDELRRHGPPQAARFTWPDVAARALAAFERLHAERQTEMKPTETKPTETNQTGTKPTGTKQTGAKQPGGSQLMPRIAFISPLPPVPDARARHAARLLPELATLFDLTSIADVPETTDAPLDATVPIRSPEWLAEQAGGFDHVIGSIGNGDAPSALAGATCVLLHDATVSASLTRMPPREAMELLYAGHGWHAVLFARDHGMAAAQHRFDCLLPFLDRMEVVITHAPSVASEVRARLRGSGPDVVCVPPACCLQPMPERQEARARLGLAPHAFVVASLVSDGPRPQRHVLDGWLTLSPDGDPTIDPDGEQDTLLFACCHASPATTRAVTDDIARFGTAATRVVQDADAMRDVVAASDLMLHLGGLAGAEAAVMVPDLLRAGIPVVTSDPAAWSGLPDAAIVALPPDPDGSDADGEAVATALVRLRADRCGRSRMAESLRTHAAAWLTPGATAEAIRAALADVARSQPLRAPRALHRALQELQLPSTAADRAAAAASIRANRPPQAATPRLFIDVSVLAIHDAGSGIQRVCRRILAELVMEPPSGYRVEPIRWIGGDYVFARRTVDRLFALDLFDLPEAARQEEPVRAAAGDVYLCADLIMETIAASRHWLAAQRLRGMRTVFVLYDLLPFQRPGMFPPNIGPAYREWITIVTEMADGVVGISQAVMQEFAAWLHEHPPLRSDPLQLGWFHLGGDMDANLAARPGEAAPDLPDTSALSLRRSFLSVGTVEPRKGYRQALAAFETLWASGLDVNYAIVGGRGWMDQAFIDRLEAHPELGNRLFWFRGVSDAVLTAIYRQATALLVVSEAEGFGLPLVEAAKFGLPIIARDIPVFREVTDGHASFFDTLGGHELAAYLATWLQQHDAGGVPGSGPMPPYTWRASAAQLAEVAIAERWSLIWQPGGKVSAV